MKEYRYDPVVTGVIVGIGLVGIWYFSSLAIEKRVLPFYFDHIFRFLAILGGAFAAFRFNSILEEKKQIKEKEKAQNLMLLSKLEDALFKLHEYSRVSKKYLWSIKRPQEHENDQIFRDEDARSEARELIYEIEVYKKLYFPDIPFEAMILHTEVERIAGECDKHWMRVPSKAACDINSRLEACKSVANEVQKLDTLLTPIFDWCLEKAERYK